MEFKLHYKTYPFKVTWAAKRDFKRETGRGLWSTIQGILPIMANNPEMSVSDKMQKVSEYIDCVDGPILLWTLAKQCNSTLQLDEIVDAVERSGWRPVGGGEYAQPYTYVLYEILHTLDKAYELEAKKPKKDLCPS